MCRLSALAAVLFVSLAATGSAQAARGTAILYSPPPTCSHTTTFTLVSNSAPLPLVQQADSAVEHQVEYQLDRYWPVGCAAFDTPDGDNDGPTLDIVSPEQASEDCEAPSSGCHLPGLVIVAWDGVASDLSAVLSHEVIETLVDPSTTGTEVCDPVAWNEYMVGGVPVSDFVLPAWLTPGSAGPWDLARALTAPGTTTSQGYIWTGTGGAPSRHRIRHFHGRSV
jgi:hypothetical protein